MFCFNPLTLFVLFLVKMHVTNVFKTVYTLSYWDAFAQELKMFCCPADLLAAGLLCYMVETFSAC